MKRLIYSIYLDIDNPQTNRGNIPLETKKQLEKYKDKLIDCKKKYASITNSEFILFGKDDRYQNFLKNFSYDEWEFNKLNFYKLYLFEELSKEYDEILYLDFDTVPVTDESIFKVTNKIAVHAVNATKKNTWYTALLYDNKLNYDEKIKRLDGYHWYVKSMCKQAMLCIEFNNSLNHLIANTGVLLGNKKEIQKLNFFKRMSEMVNIFKEVKQEKLHGERLTDMYFINNEVFFSFLLENYNIDWYNLDNEWHYSQIEEKDFEYKNSIKKSKAKIIHVIDKNFEKVFNV